MSTWNPERSHISRSGAPGTSPVESSLTLLLRAQHGDEAARDELCARYLPRLRRWAHGRVPAWARDHLDTEDLVQDTLLQSIRHLDTFAPQHEGAFCAYLCTALRNRVRDALRRATRRPTPATLSGEEPAGEPSPLDQAVGAETLRRYEAALERLSPSDRELIVARVELGFCPAQIAALLDKPSNGAARVATSRALLRLAREMSGER